MKMDGKKVFCVESGIFTTTGGGYIPEGTTVTVTEVTAPNGYFNKGEIKKVVIKPNETVKVTLNNKEQLGQVLLAKTGKEFGTTMFNQYYSLKGAVYGIYKEDGTKVTTITTDEYGKAISSNIKLGKYYTLEETAPAGYVLNQNKIPFELKYAGQTVDTAVQSTTVKEVVITGGFDLVKFGNYDWQTTLASILNPKEIIEKQVVDTNSIESFVESFSKEYFSWQQSQDSQDKRIEHLKNYLTENLQQLNTEMVRSDIPTSSIVNSFQVWSVTQNNENAYDVLFSVGQQISEGENKKNIASTYTVTVYVDEVVNMVIIKNPTIDSKPQKASYEPVLSDSDGTVDANTTEEINSFLDTFFKLYPTATEKELSYYVSNQALDVINKDYVFVELVNPVYTQVNNQVTAIVTVKYLDKETKVTQLSQFELTLQKNDNWKIIME